MEARRFYFTVHSASNLPDFGNTKVYAKVTMLGKTKSTQVDVVNGTNPKWNSKLSFIVPQEVIIQQEFPISAEIELFCRRRSSHDEYVGEIRLHLYPFYTRPCTFEVKRRDSSTVGTLIFSHVLGDQVFTVDPDDDESSLSEEERDEPSPFRTIANQAKRIADLEKENEFLKAENKSLKDSTAAQLAAIMVHIRKNPSQPPSPSS